MQKKGNVQTSKRIRTEKKDHGTGEKIRTPVEIIAATISFIGTLVAACIGFLAIREQTLIPMQATQTAEALVTSVSFSTNIAKLWEAPEVKVNTPETVQSQQKVEPTLKFEETYAPTHSENIIEKYDYLEGFFEPGFCPFFVLPPNIKPEEDKDLANREIAKLMAPILDGSEKSDLDLAPVILDSDNKNISLISFVAWISNQSTDWIILDNSVEITVEAFTVPTHVNVFNIPACGGTGDVRVFPTTELRNDLTKYSKILVFSEADFFTLEPGEPEAFYFPFHCKSPGKYTVENMIKYTYINNKNISDLKVPFSLTCPNSFSLWKGDGLNHENVEVYFDLFDKVGDYEWNGLEYISK